VASRNAHSSSGSHVASTWPSPSLFAPKFRLIGTAAATVVPTVTLQVVERDPDDERVLECAVTAKADVIVTGDLDLLSLGEYEGIRIVQVADFLDQMGASDPEP